jgi:hypothetical protein
MASNDKAGHMADTVSETMGHQRENAADGLGRAASAIHDNAESVPGGPKVVTMAHKVADGMESTASYLRDHDFSKNGQGCDGRLPTPSNTVFGRRIGSWIPDRTRSAVNPAKPERPVRAK